jgi:hypothetical protein
MDKSSSLGMPMLPQKISKRYKHQSLGMPQGTPSSSVKIRSSFKTLYFYCFVFYAFFLERLYFRFKFYFVLFAAINGWTPTCLFSLFSFNKCSLFLVLRLAFVFHLDFCSVIIISLYQGVYLDLWSMLVFRKEKKVSCL